MSAWQWISRWCMGFPSGDWWLIGNTRTIPICAIGTSLFCALYSSGRPHAPTCRVCFNLLRVIYRSAIVTEEDTGRNDRGYRWIRKYRLRCVSLLGRLGLVDEMRSVTDIDEGSAAVWRIDIRGLFNKNLRTPNWTSGRRTPGWSVWLHSFIWITYRHKTRRKRTLCS